MATILVIEDVSAVLLSLRIVLQGAGHKVTGAGDGAAGLELIAGGGFDLVITDIWMPGLSGAEVIRAGRAQSPRTRFLAISGGDPNSESRPECLASDAFGADRLLSKPFEKEALLREVALLLDPAPANSQGRTP
ncbi:response regulator [Roseomonas frigidaquae]|uniref:Response regulator n=1 Tax=Falsiroseomonas frigidaquae TaxID=487318 RepID=A0ABX1F1V8_9PROT|nr:response regulator [Falsiroseomonas frigidaquae]NKE46308.1 response regulator [Falsiroseomonas frigidaquae]